MKVMTQSSASTGNDFDIQVGVAKLEQILDLWRPE
jgi:hypothetical protein